MNEIEGSKEISLVLFNGIDESEKKRGSWFGCDGPRTYNQQPAIHTRSVE